MSSRTADAVALPGARPAITLGEALPFAFAFEARRRRAQEKRAARQLERLRNTLRQCKVLRARLASLCDAASAAAAERDHETDQESPAFERAGRAFVLHAARLSVRARGHHREGKRAGDRSEDVLLSEDETEDARRRNDRDAPRREHDDGFEFVREARAFRLAELALAPRETSRTLARNRNGVSSSAARAVAVLRGAEDPPPAFAAGTLLLELAGGDGSGTPDTPLAFERGFAEPITSAQVPAASIIRAPLRKPLLPRGAAGKNLARSARAEIVAATRAFAAAIAETALPPGRGPLSHDTAPRAFAMCSNETLRRDVVASLVAASVEDAARDDGDVATSAELARVALMETADAEALAGDALVACAECIRRAIAVFTKRSDGTFDSETRAIGTPRGAFPNAFAGQTPEFGLGSDFETENRPEPGTPSNLREEASPFDSFVSERARRTIDEFETFQNLGFVFAVAERAVRRLRAQIARAKLGGRASSNPNAGEPEEETVSVFEERARVGRDAFASAVSAVSFEDDARASVASRLLRARAIRMHSMICIALGQRAGR